MKYTGSSVYASPNIAVWMVVLLSATLRLFHLGSESLWIDEGYSIRDATELGRISAIRPLYYLILHEWMKLGMSEIWLRLLSVVLGVIAVLLLYMVAQRLFDHRVGIYASLLMAASPLHVNHSQEVRMYSFATAITILQVLFFVRFIERGKLSDMIATFITGGVAFTIVPMTITLFLAFGLFALIRAHSHRRESLLFLSGQAALFAAALPLIPKFEHEAVSFATQWSWGMGKPGIDDLFKLLRDFYLWHIPNSPIAALYIGDAYGVFMLLAAVLGAVYMWKQEQWQVELCALWLLVPIACTMVVSYLFGNIWMVRYIIYASPAYYILAALALARLSTRRFRPFILMCVFLPLAMRLGVYYVRIHHPEWRPAVAYVEKHVERGDSIALFRYGNKALFDYYYDGSAPFYPIGPKTLGKAAVTGWDNPRIDGMLTVLPKESRRVWFVLSYGENTGEYEIENYILRKYRVLDTHKYKHVRVYLVQYAGKLDNDEPVRN